MLAVPFQNADSVGYAKEYQGPSTVLEKYENKEQEDVVVENGPSMYMVDCLKREPVYVLRVETVPNKEVKRVARCITASAMCRVQGRAEP